MGINGIGTAGYPLTGYTARKTGRSGESGVVGFMETVEEKAAQGKAADQDEKAFEMVGRGAPQEVKDAWMVAAKEVNANGMGIRGNGMMSHISQMMNIDYSQFYRGITNISSYGSGAYKKDTVVKYEFNTTDEHGNKVMDKMSREETLQAMKDIRSQYGDAVIVEFSGDGMAALVEGIKGSMVSENQGAMEARNAAFQKDIVQVDKSFNDLPAYSGMYGADKAVASALENCSKEEQGFVYDIIRQNFLVGNSGSMTEEERQANISLGMKKAEYAAENFMPEESRKSFLEAMESIAKLASAGKTDSNGNMDYGVAQARYLGHGSNLVQTTNVLDMMRTMDKDAYAEYQNIDKSEDGGLSSLKYLTNWYVGAVKKDPSMVDAYEKQSEEYVEKNVKDRELTSKFWEF